MGLWRGSVLCATAALAAFACGSSGANQLAAEAASPILLDIEIKKMLDGLHLPPSLPPTLDSLGAS